MLIKSRQVLISYQDKHMLLLTGDGLSEQRGADVAALAEYAAAGNRVVLLGGSCDEAFAAAMSSHVMARPANPSPSPDFVPG